MGEPQGARRPASVRVGVDRRRRVRDDGARRLLSEPPDDGDALFRARSRRHLRHRRRIARGRRAFRRQCREHSRSDPGRTGRRRADDPGGKGSAAQRRSRERTVRQARLARPDVVHAGRHALESARRRTRAHDPDDAHRQGRAGAYRPRRRRLVPPRAPALLVLGGHPHRRRRRSRHRPGDPPPRRLGRPRNEARGRDRAQRRRRLAGLRRRFDREVARTICSGSKRRCRSKSARASAAR